MGIQQNHWIYRSPFGFVVSKMPTWFDHRTSSMKVMNRTLVLD